MTKKLLITFVLTVVACSIYSILPNQVKAENIKQTTIYPVISEYLLEPDEEKTIIQYIENGSEFDKQYYIESDVLIYDKQLKINPLSGQLKTTTSIKITPNKTQITVPANNKGKVEISVIPQENIVEDLYVIRTKFTLITDESQKVSLSNQFITYTFILVTNDVTSLHSVNINKFNFGNKIHLDFSLPWQDKNFAVSGKIEYQNTGKSILNPKGYIAIKRSGLKLDNVKTLNTKYEKIYPNDILSERWEFTTSEYKSLKPIENYTIYTYVYPVNVSSDIFEYREQEITTIYMFNILLYFIITATIVITAIIVKRTYNKVKAIK